MKLIRTSLVAALASLLALPPAHAQSLLQGRVVTTPGTPTLSTDQYAPAQMDATGALKTIGATMVPPGAPFSATSAPVTLFSIDTSGYQSIALQTTGTYVATLVYETSNDNTNWVAAIGYLVNNPGTSAPLSTVTTNSIVVAPVTGRYFRARTTAYTSGTVTVTPILRTTPITPLGVFATLGAGTAFIGSNTLRAAGTNRSASVATAAAQFIASNTSRNAVFIRNDCANPVWINFDGTAVATAGGGNIRIAPNTQFVSEPHWVSTNAISAISETAACLVTAREH